MPFYYQDPVGGDDGNDGSIGSKVQTLAALCALMSGGDTGILGNGVNDEQINNLIPSGSPGAPTVLRAANQNLAIIRPSSESSGIACITFGGKDWITISGIDCDANSVAEEGVYISDDTCTHIVIQHGKCHDVYADGVSTFSQGIEIRRPSRDCSVLDMEIYNIGARGSEHGIYISYAGNLVDGCHIHDVYGYGVHIHTDSGDSNDNVVRNSTIHDCGVFQAGVITDSGSNNQLYNLIIYSCHYGAIMRSDNCSLLNCTITLCVTAVDIQSGDSNTVENCIIWGNDDDTVYDSGTSSLIGPHNLSVDPSFVDAAAHDYHLLTGSAAIGFGTPLSGIPADKDGKLRSLTAPDAGPYEFVSAVNPSPPIETFDGYTTGVSVGGLNLGTRFTSEWTLGPGGAMTIETAFSGVGSQGGKALRSSSAAGEDTYAYRTFEPMSAATLRFELYSSITNPDSEFYGVQLHEPDVNQGMRVRFGDAGNIEAYDYSGLVWVAVCPYSAAVKYRFAVEWNAITHPNQYRVQVNEGTFTAWIGAFSILNAVNTIAVDDAVTVAHDFEIDAIGSTIIPSAGGISQLILDKILKDIDFSVFPMWISLHTAAPGLTGANEVIGGSYGRATASESYWGTAANREISNILEIQFPAMPATTVTHVGFWSASTGGTLISSGVLNKPLTMIAGKVPYFPVSTLILDLKANFSPYVADLLLEYMVRGTAFTTAPTYWGLNTGAKDDTGGHEVVGGGYGRQIATIADWQDVGSSILGDTLFSLDYEALVTFSAVPAVTIKRLSLWDASSVGHFLMWGQDKTLVVAGGDDVTIDGTIPGNLSATLVQRP